MSCDNELANEWARCSGKNTILVLDKHFMTGLKGKSEFTGENWVFAVKTHQIFSIYTSPEEFKNLTITGHFGFIFAEISIRKVIWLSWRTRFREVMFSKCCRSTRKRTADVFKFARFDERFRKAVFTWRISVDGRPNRRNKLRVQISHAQCGRDLRVILKRIMFFKKLHNFGWKKL